MVLEITDNNFDQEVLKSKLPVLVDFWVECCQPCVQLTPIIEALSTELNGKVKIGKMNIDSDPKMPGELGIRSIPTLILFKEGKQVATKIGVLPQNKLLEWINSSLDN